MRLPQLPVLTELQILSYWFVHQNVFSSKGPRNATLENKMKMIVEEENSNFDVAHWQVKPAEYEHFHGH